MAWDWTPELEEEIITRLHSESLRKISEGAGMPSRDTVTRHMAQNEEFAAKCARARKQNALFRLEKAQDELDGAQEATVSQVGLKLIELRLGDARWLAERLLAKEYGTKTQTELSGPDGGKIPMSLEIDL